MNADILIEKGKFIGWILKKCNDDGFLALRSYQSDGKEKMRLGANGELYTRGDDGWMYQVGTLEDFNKAIERELSK